MGDENEEKWKQREGVNQMDKTLVVGGARLSYSIWEVAGKEIKREGFKIIWNENR